MSEYLKIGGRYTNQYVSEPVTEVDPISGAHAAIDLSHIRIHEGSSYNVSMYHTTVKPSVPFNAVIKTGAKSCHMAMAGASQCDTLVSLRTGVVLSTTTGLSQTPRNLNRNYTDSSTATIYRQATYTTTGTILSIDMIPGGTGGTGVNRFNIGGQIRNTTEWILKPSTKYIVRMTNLLSTTKKMSLSLQWYETN